MVNDELAKVRHLHISRLLVQTAPIIKVRLRQLVQALLFFLAVHKYLSWAETFGNATNYNLFRKKGIAFPGSSGSFFHKIQGIKMISLGKLFGKYTGVLRELKAVYVINNWINRNQLQHNKQLYKQHRLKRNVIMPIGSHFFQHRPSDHPWLDQPNALAKLQEHPRYREFPPAMQRELKRFVEEGYMVLKGFFDEAEVNRHNEEIKRLLKEKKLAFNYTGRKIMEAYKVSDYINERFFRHPELLELLNFTLGKKVIPFHTINFQQGSEQRAHSDFIHMTTYPQGYLIAAWMALEDVSPDNGTLFFYPGSHRLPYITTRDYPSGNTRWRIGRESNKRYEDKIEELIQESGLKKKTFEGNKGDVFIWHANLIHGGSPIQKPGSSRKSMVAHYFAKDVICYHEISQRPALIAKA